jgi:hypothetical protein
MEALGRTALLAADGRRSPRKLLRAVEMRVALDADLTMLARLSLALARAGAVPLEV